MPYLPSHNLLFIHIPKNAGKSIESALGIGWHSSGNNFRPRNLCNVAAKWLLNLSSDQYAKQHLGGVIDVGLCAQHLTLVEIEMLGLIPSNQFRTCTSFAVVRDPFARAVSTFKHWTPRQDWTVANFEYFCTVGYDKLEGRHNALAHRRRQVDFIKDLSGDLAVHHLLRFESLDQDFSQFCSTVGLVNSALPTLGSNHLGQPWATLYSPSAVSAIQDRFREDFELLNYPLNPPPVQ